MEYQVNITITKTLTCHIDATSPTIAVILAEEELKTHGDEALWKETTTIHCKDGNDDVKLEQVTYSK